MRITELYDRSDPVVSFEFFPPKTDVGFRSLLGAIEGEGVANQSLADPERPQPACPLLLESRHADVRTHSSRSAQAVAARISSISSREGPRLRGSRSCRLS